MRSADLLDLQETYVALFDRTPSLSLHLFEHIHGDSRERGQALVDLLTKVYEDAGLFMTSEETPDYLPLFLPNMYQLCPIKIASETFRQHVSIYCPLSQKG
jgi:nitrate reductase delta subunit